MLSLRFTLVLVTIVGAVARTEPEELQYMRPSNNKFDESLGRFSIGDDDDLTIKNHWALLIAGSAGWANYRHQADVCHAYQVLIKKGMNPDRIIVMMADDIAHNIRNIHPGSIFNCPGDACQDVYAGVPHDYTGHAVNTTTFLSVLMGIKDEVIGIGSERVIASGPNDRVFVYYADHGAPGILGMPFGPYLYADDLVSALHFKADLGGFRELVIYVEACESGSIFEGMLNKGLKIFASTAANAHEPSWGTYCPSARESIKGLDTCLGDVYSVAWIENAEAYDLSKETLLDQFYVVKNRTLNHSHPQLFGTLSIENEIAGDFEGTRPLPHFDDSTIHPGISSPDGYISLPQRDSDLVPLWLAALSDTSPSMTAAKARLAQELSRRGSINQNVRSAVETLVWTPDVHTLLTHKLKLAAAVGVSKVVPHTVEAIMTRKLNRKKGQPLVDSWDCLREFVGIYKAQCGALTQYGSQHTRTFANLCNAGLSSETWTAALRTSCTSSVSPA